MYFTPSRSGVWIGMKVLGADSSILGTRKLWWMFPIKQKLNITAAFFHTIRVIKMFKTRQFFWLSIVQFPCPPGLLIRLLHIGKKMSKFGKIEHFGLSQKAAVVSNFCLIGKLRHNFLVPRMNELAPKTFMSIQTPDLHSVHCNVSFFPHIALSTCKLLEIVCCVT